MKERVPEVFNKLIHALCLGPFISGDVRVDTPKCILCDCAHLSVVYSRVVLNCFSSQLRSLFLLLGKLLGLNQNQGPRALCQTPSH